jgi:hypothetical protein
MKTRVGVLAKREAREVRDGHRTSAPFVQQVPTNFGRGADVSNKWVKFLARITQDHENGWYSWTRITTAEGVSTHAQSGSANARHLLDDIKGIPEDTVVSIWPDAVGTYRFEFLGRTKSFHVDLTEDSSSTERGDSDTNCAITYTVDALNGTELDDEVSPQMQRRDKTAYLPGTHGVAHYDENGTLRLTWADEVVDKDGDNENQGGGPGGFALGYANRIKVDQVGTWTLNDKDWSKRMIHGWADVVQPVAADAANLSGNNNGNAYEAWLGESVGADLDLVSFNDGTTTLKIYLDQSDGYKLKLNCSVYGADRHVLINVWATAQMDDVLASNL